MAVDGYRERHKWLLTVTGNAMNMTVDGYRERHKWLLTVTGNAMNMTVCPPPHHAQVR
jgi:hypothetical protein